VSTRQRNRILALNDRRLAACLTAEAGRERDEAVARLIRDEVQPRVAKIVAARAQTDLPLQPADADEIAAQVNLRVVRKLQAVLVFEEASIQDFDAWVVRLTHNVIRDLVRQRSPERTRLTNRLRYLFMTDSRLALWNHDGIAVCGMAGWADRPAASLDTDAVRAAIGGRSPDDVAGAVWALLRELGTPVRLTHLARSLAELWDLDAAPRAPRDDEFAPPVSDGAAERQHLSVLWQEIRELPESQRQALLLNLREPGGGNALLLFIAAGIATFEELAAALAMSVEALASLWNDLPLEDLVIAERLGLSRQQVINLRKSARQRLSRRMAVRSGPRR
jgi:DNA-directed RNA polymerase specialized sigma24 family protein